MDFLAESSIWQIAAVAVAVVAVVVSLWSLTRRKRRLQQQLEQLLEHNKELQRAARTSDTRSESAPPTSWSASPTSEILPKDRNQIFISYAHADAALVSELTSHLRPVARQHGLSLTDQGELSAVGETPWQQQLVDAIDRSVFAVAVVSSDYLASDFIQDAELPALLEAQKRGRLRFTWLPARPSAVETTELAKLRALLDPGTPLSTLTPSDKEIALATAAERLARLLDQDTERAGERPGARAGALGTSAPMRLVRMHLTNIRCFSEITIDLTATSLEGDERLPSLRTVFVGDNATGKSTLLRAVALGLCDESGATSLLNTMTGRMIRTGATAGSIRLEFQSDDGTRTLTTNTDVIASKSGEIVRKSADDSNLGTIVVGYGTQRTRSGTQSHDEYDVATAVSTLFDDQATLLNPELVLLRQSRWIRKEVEKIMAAVLDLQSDGVEYRSDGVQVSGPWGRERLEVLSDGYRSTSQWLLDFINWQVYAGDMVAPKDVAAIVLIDELEQHLHPHWQRRIVSRLREHLPSVQFLITSHSPLIASSVTGLDKDGWREKLVYLDRDEEGRILARELSSLRGMSVDQVLASPAFDYLIDAEPSVEAVFAEASRLASKGDDRTKGEEERYKVVKRIVGEILASQDRTLVEQEARRELNEEAEKKIEELEKAVFGEKR